jgi:tetratricopeptide (TPR) repeat protein
MPNPPYREIAETLANLGTTYLLQSKYDDAQIFLQESQDVFLRELGVEHPSTAKSFFLLGLLYKRQGKHTRAKEFLQKAIKIQEEILGKTHPDTIATREAYRGYLL